MNIKEASESSGLPTKTIRYYEDVGLVSPLRGPNGYRRFRPSDVHKLAFLARARSLGFTLEDCRTLLALWEDRSRASADVRRIAIGHLDEIDQKIKALAGLRATLSHLVDCCAGDERPDCPIIEDLAGQAAPPILRATGVRV